MDGSVSEDCLEKEEEFDIEAQESPLLGRSPKSKSLRASSSSAHEHEESAERSSNFNAREAISRAFWFLSSIEVFKLAINSRSSSSSSTSASGYASISSPEQHLTHQGSEIDEASSEIDEGSTHGISSPPHAAPGDQKKYINDEIVRKKNLQLLRDFGGVEEVRRAVRGTAGAGPGPQGVVVCRPRMSLLLTTLHSLGEACNNVTILLLFVAATLSLWFGLKEDGWHHLGWLNGAVLFATIIIIVVLTTIKSSWERWSNRKLENSWRSKGRNMKVQVEGRQGLLSESALEVGYTVVLRKGDYVPADGLFIASSGQALEIDEGLSKPTTIDADNPFLLYGFKVINGDNAQMLVTSVRMETAWGEMMSQAMQKSAKNEYKFESRLNKWNTWVNTAGIFLSILIIVGLFVRFKKWGKLDDERRFRPDAKGEPPRMAIILDAVQDILTGSRGTTRVLTTLLSLSLIAITEGVTSVISVGIIIWNRKILGHEAMERDYLACLRMASITIICTDTFGGLTESTTEVDKLYVGDEFVSESSKVASGVMEDLFDGIGTLSMQQELDSDCIQKISPLALWAEARLGMKRDSVVGQCRIIGDPKGRSPFRECCQVVIQKQGHDGFYMHCRGPLQDILPLCSTREMDEQRRRRLKEIDKKARVIAFACRKLDSPDEASAGPSNLDFVGMIGLKETRMEDTEQAISTLSNAGIRTILLSGCDIVELKIIGSKCGILSSDPDDPTVITAEKFRRWSDTEKMSNVGEIRIMGNCLPSDKTEFMKFLRRKDEVVALLGQRMVDSPALKQADIGIAVGTWSSAVARESCDIVIWEDNCFRFLASAVEQARCFQDNIRKLIQLQLIFTISSSLISFAAIVFLGDAPVTAAESFVLNLAVPLCGGLALLTGPPPSNGPSSTRPGSSSQKVLTKAMWRNIAIQVVYLTSIFLAFQHRGQAVLGIDGSSLKSLIYNGFFLCQMFVTVMCREPDKKNIFSGLFHGNKWFFVGMILLLVCQGVYAGVEQVFWSRSGLSWKWWAACSPAIGVGSLLLDLAGKIICVHA